MGDAETPVENDILSSGVNVKSDVLKIGHHGSTTSTGADFLSAVSPKAAVICVGADNSYGHPAQATLDKLAGVPVWRTDKNGTVIAMTDGKTCKLTSLGANKAPAATTKPSTTTPSTPSTPTNSDNTNSSNSGSTVSGDNSDSDSNYTGTVYITPTGKRYHYLSSCAGKNATPTTLENAKSRGLTPCSKCVK